MLCSHIIATYLQHIRVRRVGKEAFAVSHALEVRFAHHHFPRHTRDMMACRYECASVCMCVYADRADCTLDLSYSNVTWKYVRQFGVAPEHSGYSSGDILNIFMKIYIFLSCVWHRMENMCKVHVCARLGCEFGISIW